METPFSVAGAWPAVGSQLSDRGGLLSARTLEELLVFGAVDQTLLAYVCKWM